MHRELIHLYGPLAINSFGLMIIIGLIIFSLLTVSDPKRPKIVSTDQYFNLLSLAIMVGLAGGRLLFVITNWKNLPSFWHIFAFWEGGFSLLGGVIALLAVLPFYLKKHSINTLALCDLAAIYAPLLQAISRIGCFFAGCCFGIPTTLPFGILSSECSLDKLGTSGLIHPTQLYSAGALFGIFLLMYFFFQDWFKKPGQLLCGYLILMSTERFIIDFWRADREFLSGFPTFSIPQLVAFVIGCISIIGFLYFTFCHKQKRS